MEIKLSDHFNYRRLLRYTLSPVIMMIFTSIYGVVDGFFISNYAGSTAFAAVNLIIPLVFALGSVGFMLGTGGSAVVAKTLGEGKRDAANRYFSMLIYVLIALAVIMSAVGIIFIKPIAVKMGADENMLPDCIVYGRILLMGLTPFMLQVAFQSFFAVAEKPHVGLYVTVASGITNMILDYVFVGVFRLGAAGAAAATAAGYIVGGIVPLIYFLCSKKCALRLVRANVCGRVLFKSCTNGSSEMMTNLSLSIVNILYNLQLIRLAGENGVAAFGVIMYVNFIFLAAFIGYSMGCAPIISYNYGAKNHEELCGLRKKSIVIILAASVIMFASAQLLARPLAEIYVGYDRVIFHMTHRGFRLFSVTFLFAGINIFGSSFYTALNNGAISALISFLRTLVFQVIMIFLLPAVIGLDGIWTGSAAAELLTLAVTVPLLLRKKPY